MRKIFLVIITFLLIFSSTYNSFASEGYIEQLLDLNYGVEEHNIELANLDAIYFYDSDYNSVYNELRNIDRVLKTEFIKKYRNGEYSYYQVNGIIKSYKNFIYHANKFFNYLKIKEQGGNYEELDKAILTSYTNMRNSYRKVKNIVKSSK